MREERGERALHLAVDRGVRGVLGGVPVELRHEGDDVRGERGRARGLGEKEVDIAAACKGVSV